jgi:hypothetical protein
VVKPVSPEELLLKVQVMIRKRRRVRHFAEGARQPAAPALLEGRLVEITVPEVFQIAGMLNARAVRVRIEASDGTTGTAFLDRRVLLHAEAGPLTGAKAFRHLCAVVGGTFRIDGCAFAGEPTIGEGLDGILFQEAARLDHVRHLRQRIEGEGERLRIRAGAEVFVPHLDAETSQLTALIARHGTLHGVLRHCGMPEVDAVRLVAELLDAGIVESVPNPEGDHGTGHAFARRAR